MRAILSRGEKTRASDGPGELITVDGRWKGRALTLSMLHRLSSWRRTKVGQRDKHTQTWGDFKSLFRTYFLYCIVSKRVGKESRNDDIVSCVISVYSAPRFSQLNL
ncbi:hypothetical protein RRG08_002713 [Elysia crispata]|uniref:Uncharacterized protein n=1 Tax=Elysia crispata TaxID=231223 RepID=A0AAE0XTY0_9GAST|nr:hypothetical protein RRG08_002713 [Elysia crispata]